VARDAWADPVVEGDELLGEGLVVEQLGTAGGRVEPRHRRVEADAAGLGGGAIAEAAVDRVLGGHEDGDRLAPLGDVGQLELHHAAEVALAAMGGQHAHRGDRAGGHRPARQRQLAGERAGGAHRLAAGRAVEGGHAALGMDVRADLLDLLGADGRAEHRGARHLEPPRQLVGLDQSGSRGNHGRERYVGTRR
jgi:hypothetical protein